MSDTEQVELAAPPRLAYPSGVGCALQPRMLATAPGPGTMQGPVSTHVPSRH